MELMGLSDSVKGSAERGEWVGVAALLIWVLISFLKSKYFPLDVSPRARVYLALGFGQLYGVFEAVVNGMPWGAAIVRGVITSASTIFIQEVMFGGKDGDKPKVLVSGAGGIGGILLMLALLLGCTDYVKAGAIVANQVDAAADAAAPKLEERCTKPMQAAAKISEPDRRKAEAASIAARCDGVMLGYDAVRRAHIVLRKTLLAAAGGGVTVGELIDATKVAMDELAGFTKLMEGLDR